jgi:hypothetical protein
MRLNALEEPHVLTYMMPISLPFLDFYSEKYLEVKQFIFQVAHLKIQGAPLREENKSQNITRRASGTVQPCFRQQGHSIAQQHMSASSGRHSMLRDERAYFLSQRCYLVLSCLAVVYCVSVLLALCLCVAVN